MEQQRKVWTGKVIDAPKDKPIVAVVSTQEPDLVGDVIHQGPTDKGKGWMLDQYNGRGRVYWMHDPFRRTSARPPRRWTATGCCSRCSST
jgi:hypothetical protein